MSNIAIIFAAGHGVRMESTTPKQYLKIKNKPILAYTIDVFESCSMIDKIVLVVLKNKIKYTKQIIKKYAFNKVVDVIAGGNTALDSQFNALQFLKNNNVNENDIVLIHDGVRPLINQSTIENAINLASIKGNAITISPANETISITNKSKEIKNIVSRESCIVVRAPQVFYFKDIYNAHLKRKREEMTFIDSASMMQHYHNKLHILYGPIENIKVTTENDFVVCKYFLTRRKNDK